MPDSRSNVEDAGADTAKERSSRTQRADDELLTTNPHISETKVHMSLQRSHRNDNLTSSCIQSLQEKSGQ